MSTEQIIGLALAGTLIATLIALYMGWFSKGVQDAALDTSFGYGMLLLRK